MTWRYAPDRVVYLCDGGLPFSIASMTHNNEDALQAAADEWLVTVGTKGPHTILQPPDEVLLKAVSVSGLALGLIRNPSSAIVEAAIRHNGMAIYFVRNPSPSMQTLALGCPFEPGKINRFVLAHCSACFTPEVLNSLHPNLATFMQVIAGESYGEQLSLISLFLSMSPGESGDLASLGLLVAQA